VSVRALGVDELPDIEPLIHAFPHKPYRNYRALSRRRQDEVLRAELVSALQSVGGFGFVGAEGDARAAALVRPLPWDSEFFGLSMARITYVLHDSETPRSTVQAVIEAALDQCKVRGVDHLSVRVDVADADTIQVLEQAGFRMVDALATYIYHHKREPPEPLKEMGLVRPFQAEDAEQILEITRDAYRDFRGRYHLDPHLPDARSSELYVEWARKACAGEWADVVLVTENGQGYIHGWASYRRIEPVSSVSETVICGGGLGACRRDKPGAYAGLIRAATERIHASGALTECQTQLFNFPTIRVYEAVGTQFVRAEYTLHAWLAD
jgi:L-amino acid N-acyltransferase YncA